MNPQSPAEIKNQVERNGFAILKNVFTGHDVTVLKKMIDQTTKENPSFRRQEELFAIRGILQQIPLVSTHLFNRQVNDLIQAVFGPSYFPVKSIYFDKPGSSNWFVSYHQDLTISVDKKAAIPGFGPWSRKQEQFAVQPPLKILESIYTIRIHLDDTDENNGALRVIPGSHKKGIYRPETIDWDKEKEFSCVVPAGGIMIMKPLLLHASGRTVNGCRRRVIHIEFCDQSLPAPLEWAEKFSGAPDV